VYDVPRRLTSISHLTLHLNNSVSCFFMISDFDGRQIITIPLLVNEQISAVTYDEDGPVVLKKKKSESQSKSIKNATFHFSLDNMGKRYSMP
jgi:hypothetical protein